MEEYNDILFLILGWLLGLLGGPIAEAIARAYRRARLLPSLKAELIEFQYSMLLIAYDYRGFLGAIDAEFLSWALAALERYAQAPHADRQHLSTLKHALSLPPEQQNAAIARKSQKAARSSVLHSLSILEASIPSLSDLPVSLQTKLLAVRDQLAMLNQQTTKLQADIALSFDTSITGFNRQSLNENIEGGYRNLSNRAKWIVDAIDKVLAAS